MKNLADFLLAPPIFRGVLGKSIVFLEFHPVYETLDSILHKGADGHRTDASGDRSDDGCFSCHIVEIHIAHEFSGLGIAADAHVYYHHPI